MALAARSKAATAALETLPSSEGRRGSGGSIPQASPTSAALPLAARVAFAVELRSKQCSKQSHVLTSYFIDICIGRHKLVRLFPVLTRSAKLVVLETWLPAATVQGASYGACAANFTTGLLFELPRWVPTPRIRL